MLAPHNSAVDIEEVVVQDILRGKMFRTEELVPRGLAVNTA